MLETGAGVHTHFCRVLVLLSLHCEFLHGVGLLSVFKWDLVSKVMGNLQNVHGKQEGQMFSLEGTLSSGMVLMHCAFSH